MKRLASSFAASLAAVALSASAAAAATYVTYGPVGADGGFTITFGNDSVTDANFTDTFDFTLPTGRADFVVISTMSGDSQYITWSTITFNGEAFESGSAGWNEFNFLNGVQVTGGSAQHLVLSGASGGGAAYTAMLTFMPAATVPGVPEPAGWAMMIAGFGGAGAVLRGRRDLLNARRPRATA
ncbi:MAG: FxDxF family PEP-CTERM protein [Phenylobacterium sp.]|nr:FxDxF family PEP-CTERM protein [Phenylobacterium sp.]